MFCHQKLLAKKKKNGEFLFSDWRFQQQRHHSKGKELSANKSSFMLLCQQCSSMVLINKPPSSLVGGCAHASQVQAIKDVIKANLQKNFADSSHSLSPCVFLAVLTSTLDKSLFKVGLLVLLGYQPAAELCMHIRLSFSSPQKHKVLIKHKFLHSFPLYFLLTVM